MSDYSDPLERALRDSLSGHAGQVRIDGERFWVRVSERVQAWQSGTRMAHRLWMNKAKQG